MTRTAISISILSAVIVILLTILFPLTMGIIIVMTIFSIIVFVTLENPDHEEMENKSGKVW